MVVDPATGADAVPSTYEPERNSTLLATPVTVAWSVTLSTTMFDPGGVYGLTLSATAVMLPMVTLTGLDVMF